MELECFIVYIYMLLHIMHSLILQVGKPDKKIIQTTRRTCLLYLPRLLTSNSLKPSSALRSVAVIGLLCRDRVNSAVHSRKIAGGTAFSLQQQAASASIAMITDDAFWDILLGVVAQVLSCQACFL